MRTILNYCQQTAVPELSLFTSQPMVSRYFVKIEGGGGRFEAAALSHPYIYWEPGKTLYGGIECKWFNELHSYPHNTTCTQRYAYISYMNMYV